MTFPAYIQLIRSTGIKPDDISQYLQFAKRDIEVSKKDYHTIVRVARQITGK